MKLISLTLTIVFSSKLIIAQTTGSCAAQQILDTCISNEDTYLRTCTIQDYACLCKWHTAKLSCYDNCPNDLGRPAQQGLKETFCSIAQTFNTTANSVSSISSIETSVTAVLPSNPTPGAVLTVSSNNINTAKATSTNIAGTNNTSDASFTTNYYACILLIMTGVSSYFLI